MNRPDRRVGTVAGSARDVNSQSFIKSLVEHALDIMGVCDAEGRLLHINQAVERLLGYTSATLVGKPVVNLVHADDLDAARAGAQALRGLAATSTRLLRVRHADGTWVPMEVLGRQWTDTDGAAYWLLHVRDITARRKGDDLVRLERDLLLELARARSPEDALSAVLKTARCIDVVDGGGVYRYDERRGLLKLVAAEGLPDSFVRKVAAYNKRSPQMALVRRGQVVYLKDTDETPVADQLRAAKIRMIAVLPLQHEGRLHGVLNLATFKPRPFSANARVSMETLARYTSLILDNMEQARALRESEERYRELVEVAPDGVVVHVEGRFVYANPAAAHICGVDQPADLVGRTVYEFLHPDHHDASRERIGWLLAEGGRIVRAEVMIRQPSGHHVLCEFSGTRITYQGQPAVQTLIRRKEDLLDADHPLRSSESRFQAVFETATEGILVFHADGTCLYANSVARSQLDVQHGGSITGHTSPEPWARHARKVAAEGRPLMFEETLALGGVAREVVCSWVPITDRMGRVEGASCVYRDMTERARLAHERRLLAQNLLEVQERERKSVSDFLHDHMGPQLIMAKIALEELARVVPARGRELVDQVAARLDEALSGIRHKALSVRPPLLDDLEVKDALEFLVEEFQRNHQLNIELAPVPHLPALSPALKTCLYRVLQEALHNVVTHAHATVTSVVVVKQGAHLLMGIRDNGVGFDPQSVSPGDRLGLIGMREIVNSFGGSLILSSSPGRGTSVEVMVPVVEEKK